jgi:hypothetical protein
MVQLMHAGATQSPVGSTVVFVSDTSVPVRTCSATVAAVRGKILLGKVGLYVTGEEYMCKSLGEEPAAHAHARAG